jgi:hypothetical protein
MSEVEKFEALAADIERKRADCVRRGTELADERAAISLAACTGDAKAAKRLTEIHAALAAHSSELASVDAALKAAAEKLAVAERNAAQEEDRKAARRLRTVAQRMKQRGKNLDAALAIVTEELVGLQADVSEIHGACGSQFPSHQQRDVFCYQALLTALKRTSFDRRFEPISSVNHITFRALVMQWCAVLEKNAAARLGEAETTEAA